MKKLIKNNLKVFVAILITAIICISGTAYATIKIQASEIEYSEGISVKDKIDDLYTVQNTIIVNKDQEIADLTTQNTNLSSQVSSLTSENTRLSGPMSIAFGTSGKTNYGLIHVQDYRSRYTKFKITSISCGSSGTGYFQLSDTNWSSVGNGSVNTTYLTSNYTQINVYSNGSYYCAASVTFFN